MGGIDEDASMLWCDDGFNDSSKIVDIWQCFYTKQDVIKSSFPTSCILWSSDDCAYVSFFGVTLSKMGQLCIP